MATDLGFGVLLFGCIWLLSAHPVHSRGDTFLAAPTPGNELEEQEDLPDDILEINQGLILPEAPESSFLLEGDIIKRPFRLFSSASPRWPKKKEVVHIPYIISYKYDQLSLGIIREAFEDFAKFTCVRFVPYSHQKDFIFIVPLSGCFSSAGRIGGMQVVSLAPACLRRSKGAALHELMHALGFWHEHSGADRDKYISIAWNEILTGFEINFIKSRNANMLDDYNYASVMHYGRNAFSMAGSPTIIPLARPSTFLGQRWNLSNSDIARVNKLYKCSHAAAQPEVPTGEVIKETVEGFLSPDPESWSAENSPSSHAFFRGTTEPIMTSKKILGEGQNTKADHRRTAKPQDQSLSVPAETSGRAKASREFQMATEQVLDTTQDRPMETRMKAGTLEKASALLAQQNPTPGWQLQSHLPGSLKAPVTSGESLTEARPNTSPETEHTFSSEKKGPSLPLVATDHRTTVDLGREEASVELSGTEATYLESTAGPSTAVELASSSITGSSERASSSTEGHHEMVGENPPNEQVKGVFRQPVSVSIHETGRSAYKHPGEDVWDKVTNSLYISSPHRNPTTVSNLVETQGTKAEDLTNAVTMPVQSGLVEKEGGSLYLEKATVSTYSWSPSSRRQYEAKRLGEALPPNLETSVPEIVEPRTNYFDWVTPGVRSSLQGTVTGHPAPMGSSYNSSSGYSLLPTHLAWKGYRWSTSLTQTPPRSVSLHELLKEAGQQVLNHAELLSPIPSLGNLASSATETNQSGQPTDQTSLPLSQSPKMARLGSKVFRSQPSKAEVYSSSSITVGWSPPADRQRHIFEHTTETASIATTERPSMTQKIDVIPGEGHGRTTLSGQFPTVPSGSQVSPQLERGAEQTQSQLDSTFSIKTGSSEIQSGISDGLRTMVTPKQCGGKLGTSVPGTTASHTEHTHMRLTLLCRPLSLGTAGKGSPKPATQEYGPTSRRFSLPGKEISTSPRWVSGSRTPEDRHGPSEKTSSTTMNELMQTIPKKRAPEINGVSGTRASEPTVDSSSIFTILAQSKPTWKRIQSSFSLGRTESVTNTESLPTQFLEQVTGVKVSSKEIIPLADERSAVPANPTVKLTTDGMSGVTVPVQEGTVGRWNMRPRSLEIHSTSTEGTALFRTAGSSLAPKLVNQVAGYLDTHLRMDSSSLPTEMFPHGTTAGSTTIPSSTITLGSQENQTVLLNDVEEVTRSTSKKSGAGQMESQGSALVSSGIHWVPHVGIVTLGSSEGHTELPQIHSELQTGRERREGTTWPASVQFQEKKWKSLTKQSGLRASEEPLSATRAGIGSKGATQLSTGIPVATSLRMKSSSHLTSTYSTEETEEPTVFFEKVYSSSRPSSKWYSVAFLPSHSGTGTLKMTPSVSGGHRLHGAEKMGTADVHQMGTESPKVASASTRISQVHLQTLGSAEMKKESYMTHGTGHLDGATKTPIRMGNGERFPLATESPRPASETPITMKLVEMIGSLMKERKPGKTRALLASKPTDRHDIHKRSQPRRSAKMPVFILPSLAPECKLLASNIGELNPRKLNTMKLFPKERILKFVMASLGGTTQHPPPAGCSQLHLSDVGISQKHVAPQIENMTPMEPRKSIARSTSRSKPLSHFRLGIK